MTSRRRTTKDLPNPSDRQIRAGIRIFDGLPAVLRTLLVTFFCAALVLLGLSWLRSYQWDLGAAIQDTLHGGGQAVSTGFAGSGVETYGRASEVLGTLTVAEPAASAAYRRDLFGDPWADIDSNGCDQRNDILARDLTNLEVSGTCRVLSGTITDPYTADTIDFVRGPVTSEAVPIDHVVALSNAWSSGASDWDREQRVLLANDPLNLQATGQEPNSAKSDKSADVWLPQAGYRCEYVARQISVKAAYGLSVTAAEKGAMVSVLATCPEQPAYRSDFAR